MERFKQQADRRGIPRGIIVALGSLLAIAGCTQSAMRSQSPEDFERVLADVQLVGDVSVPFGLHPLQIQSVGLVTNLANTGRGLPPSAERAMLIGEIQRRSIERPNELIDNPRNSAVIVRGMLPPGIQKGDRYDVELTVPAGCETTSLRGGMLLPARMSEKTVRDNQIHEGSIMGVAEGSLMIDPMTDEEHRANEPPRATIVQGGLSLFTRPLGLMIRPDDRSVRTSAQIATTINQRFYVQRHGIKTGVATAKTDRYIELVLYPRYKDNLARYFQVVRSLPVNESATQRQMRLELLERQLLDAVTSASAALRLEAIGKDGKDVLKKGIASSDPEVRFYSAEALAYLDDAAAAGPLAAAARDESAFRARAFAALSAMDDMTAYDELATLLDVSSAETRYGAFRALWAMNSRDPLVRGERVGDQFTLHVLRCKGPTMVHVTRAFRPEIVIFGTEPQLRAPLILNGGKSIVIRDMDGERLAVSRFSPGTPDQRREVGNHVSDLARAIVDVGGSYPDVVQALAQAKASGALSCRFEIDAVPKSDRDYIRPGSSESSDEATGNPTAFPVEGPTPELYPGQTKSAEHSTTSSSNSAGPAADSSEPAETGHHMDSTKSKAGEAPPPESGSSVEPQAGKSSESEPAPSWSVGRRLGKMFGWMSPSGNGER